MHSTTATALLPYGKTRLAPLQLEFTEDVGDHRQNRIADRSVLTPKINLKDYRFKAVIDWIVFRVSIEKCVLFKEVQNVLIPFLGRKPYVKPIDPDEDNKSCVFDITIQEPQSGAYINEINAALALEFGQTSEALICALEISLDAYPRTPSDTARRAMVGIMQRTIFTKRDIWTKAGSRPRCSKGEKTLGPVDMNNRKLLTGRKNGAPCEGYLLPENHSAPWIDGTMYLGAQKDDVMIKVMDKVVDVQNRLKGTFKTLTMGEQRARIEVTLRDDELHDLGLSKLSDLQMFSFSKLQGRYFQFKLPTFCITPRKDAPLARLSMIETAKRRTATFLKTGVVGLHARDTAQAAYRVLMLPKIRKFCHQGGRQFCERRVSTGSTGTFVSYAEMNKQVATAFRHLVEAEARAWNRKVRTVPTF